MKGKQCNVSHNILGWMWVVCEYYEDKRSGNCREFLSRGVKAKGF